MRTGRILVPDGMVNARGLGELQADRGRTRRGAIVRSEHPASLSALGWQQLHQHGVRTIIALTSLDEEQPDCTAYLRAAGVGEVELAALRDRVLDAD